MILVLIDFTLNRGQVFDHLFTLVGHLFDALNYSRLLLHVQLFEVQKYFIVLILRRGELIECRVL